jgi:ketosteroid isomerase-like protein
MDNNEAKQEILSASGEWAAAMVANDADAIGSFMADEWIMVSERGISTKEHFLSFVRSGALTHSSFDLVGEPRVDVYGDTAIVTCRVTNTAHFNGQRFDADEWTTDVLVKRDGRWRGVHSHITSVNKEFEAAMMRRRENENS